MRRIKNKLLINIVIDGCNAGAPNPSKGELNLIDSMGKRLRQEVNKLGGYNIFIHIKAPYGFAYWHGSPDPSQDRIEFLNLHSNSNFNIGYWKESNY